MNIIQLIKKFGYGQSLILLSGFISTFLFSFTTLNVIMWAFICNLLTEPFWFITTLKNKQYGMFILCVWATIMYIVGLINCISVIYF